MRVHFLARLAVGLTLFAAGALAQDQAADMSAQSAVIHRPAAGQNLTGPSQDAPGQIVADFLRANGRSNQTASSLVAVSENPTTSGITHVRLEQLVGGLTIYGAYVKAALNAQGELIQVIEMLAPVGPVGRAGVNETDALNTVVGQLYPSARPGLGRGPQNGNTVSFTQNGFFYQDPTVTRVIVPLAGGRLQEGYLVETWTQSSNLLHHTLVSGNGQIVSSELRTNQDSYNIFPNYPGALSGGTQTVVANPADAAAASPGGWLLPVTQYTRYIRGTNVNAYLDTDANNSPDSATTVVTEPSLAFTSVANLNTDPANAGSGFDNKAAAVQNLFYFNSLIHDVLYKHGFTEAAGNFQANGNDPVNAEAQDGSGTNNANFSTPSDGSSPRMQMYLWTQTTPRRDGDLDSDIIYHEYGHGLTWRMIGGMSGPMSGAIGEGMSDVLAILMNDNDVVGEYSYNRTLGIRRYAYTNYPLTYGDFTGQSVHNDGEIYAAAVWKLWQMYKTQPTPISRDVLLSDLVGGMNFTPSGPAMEDMRDGILTQAGDARRCLIWEAFAAFGIGEGARASVKGGGPFGGGKVSVNESFAMPSDCSDPPPPAELQITTVNLASATSGQPYSDTLQATGGKLPYVWAETGLPGGLTLNSSTGEISGSTTVLGTATVHVTVTDDGGNGTAVSKDVGLVVGEAPAGTAPAAPTGLTLSAKKPFVMVSWTDASNNENGFYVNRCTGTVGCTLALLATVPSGTTNYKDTSAVNGVTYTYSVVSFNDVGTNSTPSQSITK